eukprot:gene19192-biopygen742
MSEICCCPNRLKSVKIGCLRDRRLRSVTFRVSGQEGRRDLRSEGRPVARHDLHKQCSTPGYLSIFWLLRHTKAVDSAHRFNVSSFRHKKTMGARLSKRAQIEPDSPSQHGQRKEREGTASQGGGGILQLITELEALLCARAQESARWGRAAGDSLAKD